MKKYEVMYIISAKADDKKRDNIITKFDKLIKDAKGEIISIEKIGMKKLAYPINYQKEGFYVLMRFLADEKTPIELERQLRLTDNIIRFLILADYDRVENVEKKRSKKRKKSKKIDQSNSSSKVSNEKLSDSKINKIENKVEENNIVKKEDVDKKDKKDKEDVDKKDVVEELITNEEKS